MEFVKLDYKVLAELKVKGYNALRARSDVNRTDLSWVPDEVDVKCTPYSYIKTEFIHFLLIENVLAHATEMELTGMVFLEK